MKFTLKKNTQIFKEAMKEMLPIIRAQEPNCATCFVNMQIESNNKEFSLIKEEVRRKYPEHTGCARRALVLDKFFGTNIFSKHIDGVSLACRTANVFFYNNRFSNRSVKI